MSQPGSTVPYDGRDFSRFLGAKLRPGLHPTAAVYRFPDYLAAVGAPRVPDLSQPRFLPRPGFDPRWKIDRQGMSDCAAWAACRVAYLGANMAGESPAGLMHPNVPYYLARVKEKTFPSDLGSYPEDDLNAIIDGAPLLTAQHPYDPSPAAAPHPDLLNGTAPRFDWLFSFRNAYPSDDLIANIWLALDQGLAIEIAVDWPKEWFDPHGGIVPNGVPRASSAGGHAFDVWGILPATLVTPGMPGWYITDDNQWGDEFSTDAPAFAGGQAFMRPGSFAIHSDYLTGANPRAWYIQVCTPERAPTPPTPPNPEPTPPVPPTPDDKCLAALQRGQDVAERLTHEWEAAPRSVLARGKKLGADLAVSAFAGE